MTARSRDEFEGMELAGHGVGRYIHEDPEVPNFEDPRLETRFQEGDVVAVEPILSAGSGEVETLRDGWTIRTRDRALAAHHEHTLLVTRAGPRVLTLPAGRRAAAVELGGSRVE